MTPKEDRVRRMMDTPHPPVPPDLARRASTRGARIDYRRRVTRRVALLTLLAAVTALLTWLAVAGPWPQQAPSVIAPPPRLL